jgi:carboxypeptidase C (cathepsin A)
MRAIRGCVSVMLAILASGILLAQAPGKEETTPAKEEKTTPVPPERTQVTHHELLLEGKSYKYSAVAGTLLIDGDDAKPYGSVFYVAYTLDGVTDLRSAQ